MKIPIHRTGRPLIFCCILISIIISLIDFWLALPILIVTILVINFFRDPDRKSKEPQVSILSPADGKIIDICNSEHPVNDGECLKISIFMNIFNVHVNRSPIDGRVISVDHKPGRFLKANDQRASSQNEHVDLLLDTSIGKILIRLVAGLVARRIVTFVMPDDDVSRGDRISIIKFGSRVDVYLPCDIKINSSIGDNVYGGKTRIATIISQTGIPNEKDSEQKIQT